MWGYLPMFSRLQEENAYHFVVFFLDIFLPGLDCRLAIDSSSHVRLHL